MKKRLAKKIAGRIAAGARCYTPGQIRRAKAPPWSAGYFWIDELPAWVRFGIPMVRRGFENLPGLISPQPVTVLRALRFADAGEVFFQ